MESQTFGTNFGPCQMIFDPLKEHTRFASSKAICFGIVMPI
jgi:hypothetical protein